MPKSEKYDLMLIDADYTVIDNNPIVRLYGRTKDGKSIVIFDNTFEPYLYVQPKKDIESLKKKIGSLSFNDNSETISVKKVEEIEMTLGITKTKLIKVYCNLPGHVPKIKDAIKDWPETENKYEFDILFFRRYLMDRKLLPMTFITVTGVELKDRMKDTVESDIKLLASSIRESKPSVYTPKILAFDLETVPEGIAQKIILASIYTTAGYKKVLGYVKNTYPDYLHLIDEKDIIEELIRITKKEDPDFLVTYNGDAFDMPVLRDRSKKYKAQLIFGRDKKEVIFQTRGRSTPAVVRGRVHIDLFQFISVIMRATIKSEVLTLDAVSKELLGESKIGMTWEEMLDNWNHKKNLDRFAEYCLKDSLLAYKLAGLILPNIFALSRLTGQVPNDVCRMTYGQLVESYAMRRAAGMNIIVPNRPTRETIDERREQDAFIGAFVVEPKPGLHENIAVFDFRSLYPSIIVSHNIDPSTLNCGCCKDTQKNRVPDTNYYFCTKNHGFIPTVLNDLVDERIRIKNLMKETKKGTPDYVDLYAQQYALKTVSNAFYGYLGFAGSRWYRRECGESVTGFGRHYIHEVIDTAKTYGFDIVYGDTDSVFLKLADQKQDLSAVAKKFLKDVNSKLPGIMELEFEGTFVRGIFVKKKVGIGGAKKRYALIDKDGNLTIRGFEKVRRDWSRLAKDTQETVLRMVLSDKVDEAVAYVKDVIVRLKTGKVPLDELGIYTSVKRELKNYDQIGPHVAASRKAETRGIKILPGQTIQYVITNGSGSISDKAELIQFAKDYDKDYYIKKQILPAAMRALSVFNITEDELMGNGKQTGLARFAAKK
ncbi:MAG: DNA-directed DNA polymerase [archaeon]